MGESFFTTQELLDLSKGGVSVSIIINEQRGTQAGTGTTPPPDTQAPPGAIYTKQITSKRQSKQVKVRDIPNKGHAESYILQTGHLCNVLQSQEAGGEIWYLIAFPIYGREETGWVRDADCTFTDVA